jgi:hypothetical protein
MMSIWLGHLAYPMGIFARPLKAQNLTING